MIKICEDNSLYLVKGNTAYLKVNVTNGYNFYQLQSGDSLIFSLKKKIDDIECALQLFAYMDQPFCFKPEDTIKLNMGTYFYDIKLTTSQGDVYTVIPISQFHLIPNIGEN